jgi:transposase InsO family protein
VPSRSTTGHGITVERVLTDNGGAYRSTIHAAACRTLRIRHLRTRAYRPQTNGKAERFIRNPLKRLGLRRDLPLKYRTHRRP